MLAKFQRHAQEKRKKQHDREKSTTVSLPPGLVKICFKVKMSSNGKWKSNDCSNCENHWRCIAREMLKTEVNYLSSVKSYQVPNDHDLHISTKALLWEKF